MHTMYCITTVSKYQYYFKFFAITNNATMAIFQLKEIVYILV